MLTESQIKAAAQSVGIEPAAVRAVLAVESSGKGFWVVDGAKVPIVNFEAQWFHRLTNGRFSASHPDLSMPKGMDRLFGPGEWHRYRAACKLDETAAMKSTSFGLFQIMGFNHALCGYPSVQEFVRAMSTSEEDQLRSFLGFVQGKGLIPALRARDWKTFARVYNGPNYQVNNYDVRLEKAYRAAGGVQS